MAKIALLSCTKAKRPYKCKASELYSPSPWFPTAYKYVKQYGADKVFILSSLYGLVHEDTVIEPYEATLNSFTDQQKHHWANSVINELRKSVDLSRDEFIIIAGRNYYQHLLPHLEHVYLPLKGLGLYDWLPKLKELLNKTGSNLDTFYPNPNLSTQLRNKIEVKDFERAINIMLENARRKGDSYVDIVSGQVHRLVGGYPGQNHKMPTCCNVMYRMMKARDQVLESPPSGKGASLKIRYFV